MDIRPIFTLLLAALLTAGCDKNSNSKSQLSPEAQELLQAPHDIVEAIKMLPDFVRETPGAIKAIYEALRVLHGYVAENDYEKARSTAATLDRVLKSRSLSWYVQILALEEAEGIPAALSLIEELRKTDGISKTEDAALNHFVTYLGKKGEFKSLDVLFLIGAAALESKAGKGAGVALLALQYPVRPDDVSSTMLKSVLEAEFSGAKTPLKSDAEQDPKGQLPAQDRPKAE